MASFHLKKIIILHEGTGSVLNLDGDVEMDALVMEGRDLNAGARSNKIPCQFRLYLLFAPQVPLLACETSNMQSASRALLWRKASTC